MHMIKMECGRHFVCRGTAKWKPIRMDTEYCSRGSKGVWEYEKNRGHMTRHGLTYTFDIRQTDYSEKISLDYRCRTLDDFLALSDNKFTPKS